MAPTTSRPSRSVRRSPKIDEHTGEDSEQAGQQRASSYLDSIERSLESIETMRTKIQQQQSEDLAVSKKLEVAKIGEENLRNNLERQRPSSTPWLINSNKPSSSATLEAWPHRSSIRRLRRRRVASVVHPRLRTWRGLCLGGGAAYIADLLDPHVRTLVELRRILDLAVLGVVPQLSRNQVESLAGEVCSSALRCPARFWRSPTSPSGRISSSFVGLKIPR